MIEVIEKTTRKIRGTGVVGLEQAPTEIPFAIFLNKAYMT